jgi:chromosome partitioning protein
LATPDRFVNESFMHVVAIASCKGGAGKTTLAGHLAVAAERAGIKPALIVDTDPQGTLSDWWEAREAQTPMFARALPERLGAGLEQIRALGVALLVIDTPPAIEATQTAIIRIADLVVIPVRPSPHDLRAVGATVALAEQHAKPFIFVVNGAAPRSRIANEGIVALAQHGTVAPVIIHQRTGFAASMIDGRTVMELPGNEPSALEIEQLWAYLDQRLAAKLDTVATPMPVSSSHKENGTWAA